MAAERQTAGEDKSLKPSSHSQDVDVDVQSRTSAGDVMYYLEFDKMCLV